jgi:hypothetical protein
MTLQPPPYTSSPAEQDTKIELPKLQLHRFLIDSVAFAYKVDYDQLKLALSSSDLSSNIRENTLLPQHDRDRLLHVAAIVHDTVDKTNKV